MRNIPAIILYLYSAAVLAQSGNLSFVGATTGAACYEVEYYNNHLLTGEGNTFRVYSLDVNGEPDQILFTHRFRSNICDIKIRNNYAYIASNHSGLSVWNVSNLSLPLLVDEYDPLAADEAAYDIAFKGTDSVFIAFKQKMALFTFNGSSLSAPQVFALQPNGTYVMGCAIKNNLLAFVTSGFDINSNATTGVHLYNASLLNSYSFTRQDTCDPHDVVFGQNTSLLHVLGGTSSWVNASPVGYVYSLDVQFPTTPTLVFSDTLPGIIYLAVAQPMNAEIRNDTLFVATQASTPTFAPFAVAGHAYIYDCTVPSSIQLISDVNCGLWFFDLALNGNRLYAASEWYGIKTLDISNILVENDLGNTLTGGWNLGSDAIGNKLVVANEGYGFKVFDISNPFTPVLLDTNRHPGFCWEVSWSADSQHIYAWYYTNDDFRVFNASSLALEGTLQLNAGLMDYFDAYTYQDKAIVVQKNGGTFTIYIIDVANPNAPMVNTSISLGGVYNDIHVDQYGYLYVARNFFLDVYNLNAANDSLVTSIFSPGGAYTRITSYKDTVFAYMRSTSPEGMRKYQFNGSVFSLLTTPLAIPLPNNSPEFLAADSFGLYASYQEQGLFQLSKSSFAQTGFYRHGQEFYRPTNWGQEGLFCKDNRIFLVEYKGQTSILSGNQMIVGEVTEGIDEKCLLLPYPVPSSGIVNIPLPDNHFGVVAIDIYNISGMKMGADWSFTSETIQISDGLSPGIYFFRITDKKGMVSSGKFIIE